MSKESKPTTGAVGELSDLAAELAVEALRNGQTLRYIAHGDSMRPFVMNGDRLTIQPIETAPQIGDVLLCALPPFGVVHRVVAMDAVNQRYLIQGDASQIADGWFERRDILGKLVHIDRQGQSIPLLRGTPALHATRLCRTLRRKRGGALILKSLGRCWRLNEAIYGRIKA